MYIKYSLLILSIKPLHLGVVYSIVLHYCLPKTLTGWNGYVGSLAAFTTRNSCVNIACTSQTYYSNRDSPESKRRNLLIPGHQVKSRSPGKLQQTVIPLDFSFLLVLGCNCLARKTYTMHILLHKMLRLCFKLKNNFSLIIREYIFWWIHQTLKLWTHKS